MVAPSTLSLLLPLLLLLLFTVRVSPCSFLVTSDVIPPASLPYINFYLKMRGPDKTNHVRVGDVTFVHNLLHMTGAMHVQPFVSADKSVVALFNGEIYNYRELGVAGTPTTDGEVLLPMYAKHGETFVQKLRGEFAIVIVDLAKGTILLSTDAFGTKPFWAAETQAGGFAVASYASALTRLGASRGLRELDANKIEVRDLTSFALLRSFPVFTFDTRQYKTTLADWDAAFTLAMTRRTTGLLHGVFVGLSSGYDSGVIALALAKSSVPHHLFTIIGPENEDVVNKRFAYPGHGTTHMIRLRESTYANSQEWLLQHAEAYDYASNLKRVHWKAQDFRDDPGAIGISHICELARPLGVQIYLSGMGVDEIYTDYEGKASQSTFGGKFPSDLKKLFPWPGFYGETMRSYLRKEEYVSGAHGMEGRYPFLDVDLVQEFLWLTAELKNSRFKRPLYQFMHDAGYALHAVKTGFNARAKLQKGKDETVRAADDGVGKWEAEPTLAGFELRQGQIAHHVGGNAMGVIWTHSLDGRVASIAALAEIGRKQVLAIGSRAIGFACSSGWGVQVYSAAARPFVDSGGWTLYVRSSGSAVAVAEATTPVAKVVAPVAVAAVAPATSVFQYYTAQEIEARNVLARLTSSLRGSSSR